MENTARKKLMRFFLHEPTVSIEYNSVLSSDMIGQWRMIITEKDRLKLYYWSVYYVVKVNNNSYVAVSQSWQVYIFIAYDYQIKDGAKDYKWKWSSCYNFWYLIDSDEETVDVWINSIESLVGLNLKKAVEDKKGNIRFLTKRIEKCFKDIEEELNKNEMWIFWEQDEMLLRTEVANMLSSTVMEIINPKQGLLSTISKLWKWKK